MRATPQKLEALRAALEGATERLELEQKAWSVLTGSKDALERSIRLNGGTPTDAQLQFLNFMADHEEKFTAALDDLEQKRKEFSKAYRQYCRDNI